MIGFIGDIGRMGGVAGDLGDRRAHLVDGRGNLNGTVFLGLGIAVGVGGLTGDLLCRRGQR